MFPGVAATGCLESTLGYVPRCCCYRVSGEYTEVCSQVLLLQGVWRVHWGMFPGVAATGCLESTLGYAAHAMLHVISARCVTCHKCPMCCMS